MRRIPEGTAVVLREDRITPAVEAALKDGFTNPNVAATTGPDDPEIDDADVGYSIRLENAEGNAKLLWVHESAVTPANPLVAREVILKNAREARAEIQQIFADAASWNDNSQARQDGAAAIDPDPHGELARLAAGLDKFIARETA